MAFNPNIALVFYLLFMIFSISNAATSFRPKALVLPVQKDPSTLQYLVQVEQRTPLVPVKVTLDLGGQFLWVDCDQSYTSSTYKPIKCNSAQCNLSRSKSCITACYSPPRPGCTNNTCGVTIDNTVTRTATGGGLGQDVLSIQSTDGSNPGKVASVSNLLFGCASTFILEGLSKGVQGMAGLGRTKVSLSYQFSSAFSFHKKFALCLTSSTSAKGVVFFGEGPFVLLPNNVVSESLTYTPLILNPVSTASAYFQGDPSSDYFIGVKSIKINGNPVALNTSLLTIDKEGYGGTKISTVNPYTAMETSIYKAFINAYAKALSGVPRVASIAPFGLCFNSTKIGHTILGAAVPEIDLVLSSSVIWSIYGANSMVQVKNDVLCLGFVDGGVRPSARTSIVIGGFQLENNFLLFDLAASRLGFSSLLFGQRTTCANFNFTTKA